MPYTVTVLFDGYSELTETGMKANCSCTLIQGDKNIIVDTMTPWDKDKILAALKEHKLMPSDIQYVINTHGHSDHIGNNNLFLKAQHIVGYSISYADEYFNHSFETGEPYMIDDDISIVPTPGHTLSHVSVVIQNVENFGTVVVAGDLFEKEEDLQCEDIWKSAGSENEDLQNTSRNSILRLADWIIPGHGKMFKVKREPT